MLHTKAKRGHKERQHRRSKCTTLCGRGTERKLTGYLCEETRRGARRVLVCWAWRGQPGCTRRRKKERLCTCRGIVQGLLRLNEVEELLGLARRGHWRGDTWTGNFLLTWLEPPPQIFVHPKMNIFDPRNS